MDVGFEDLGEKSLETSTRGRSGCSGWRMRRSGTATQVRAARDCAAGSQPSVAVLPFANMSGDPEQEFFVDGLTEDILTELARPARALRHRAKLNLFVYKGQRRSMIREESRKNSGCTVHCPRAACVVSGDPSPDHCPVDRHGGERKPRLGRKV